MDMEYDNSAVGQVSDDRQVMAEEQVREDRFYDADGGRRSASRSRSRSLSPKRRTISRSRSRSRSISPRRGSSRGHRSRRRSPSRSRSRSRDRRRSVTPPRRRYRSRSPRGRGGGGSRAGGRRGKEFHGTRDAPEKSQVLGVFGLSLRTRESDLEEVFKQYGNLEKVTIVYDHRSNRSRGFGFINYSNVEEATRAREATDGLEIDDRNIRVDYSVTHRPHTPTPADVADPVHPTDVEDTTDQEAVADLGLVEED
ncbi:uncharacterized protein BYT42DRAFT_642398 [Radiomyces spectabilis]|uniref:uncharacterized protein n=1 Tax=Radiomyces spectabilis TaxID=64574 RepID=UPI00221E9B5E|nr:uncharacterized protein BYT42DRAFT_642398 [Radiomyces spectabilis]KAI8388131.1 hypothetical protein BYT42DRAFT_642398 [Radiomyces spectabilis]